MRAFILSLICAAGVSGGTALSAQTDAEAAAKLERETQRITVPKGYKPAWTDGRLNVHRGAGTSQGEAQMLRTWTQSVPRKLIDRDG